MTYEEAIKREAIEHGVTLTDEDIEKIMRSGQAQFAKRLWDSRVQEASS
jgi:hypothetical protein